MSKEFSLCPEGAFSFNNVLEGQEKPWRKKGNMETNKQTKKVKQI